MNGLKRQFENEIEFIDLDIDRSEGNIMRAQYGITGRTQYVLVTPDDVVEQRWFGVINEDELAGYLRNYLDEQRN